MNPQVDLLITGCHVVCFDLSETIIEDGAIGVTGNTITWLGKSAEAPSAKDTLHAKDTIAMPGLIDCHVHTAQQFPHAKLQPSQPRAEFRIPRWHRYLIPFKAALPRKTST